MPGIDQQLSILLLCDDYRGHAGTILDHISALRRHSRHRIYTYNPHGVPNSAALDLNEFDVVVIHYSLPIISDAYLAPSFRAKIRQFQGLKVQFIQDDYRWVDQITTTMRYLGIHVLFTLVPEPEIPKIWNDIRLPGVLKRTALAGYVPDRLIGLQTPSLEERPIDIGYRGRLLPYWLGKIGQEKVWIGQGVLERAPQYGLKCDIAWREEDRIYGRRWDRFLQSCRAILGSESGATITDFDGSLEGQVNQFLGEHPTAGFWEVYREILEPYENNVRMNIISPRMFEAIAAHSALILFPGDYSGILKPWEHYIPLEKDFSNMDQVVEKLRDATFLKSMIQRAYDDVVASGRYSYRVLAEEFDKVLDRHGQLHGARGKVKFYLSLAERPLRVVIPALLRLRDGLLIIPVMLAFLMRGPAMWRIALRYLRHWKRYRPRGILKDIALLAVAWRILVHKKPLLTETLVSRIDETQGLVQFVCTPPAASPPLSNNGRTVGNQASDWLSIEAMLRDSRITKMVWDHSAVGADIVCHLPGRITARIRTNGDGIHNFELVVNLSKNDRT